MLERQTIALPLRGGLDTKTDSRQTPAAKLQVVENAAFTRPGSLRKMPGYDALAREIANPFDPAQLRITEGRGLASFKSELVLFDPARMYSFDVGTEKWIDKGPMISGRVTQAPVVRNIYGQTYQDGATHASGLQLYAWEDTSGGVRYAVVDETTGQTVVGSTLVSTTAKKPKVLAFGNYLVLWFLDVADALVPILKVALLPVSDPTRTLAPIVVTGVSGSGFRQINPTTPTYDACIVTGAGVDDQMYLAFHNAADVVGRSVYQFPLTSPTAPAGMYVDDEFVPEVMTVFGDPAVAGAVVASWDSGTGALTVTSFAPFVAGLTQTVLSSDNVFGLTGVVSLTGCAPSGVAGTWRIALGSWDPASVTYNALTRLVSVYAYMDYSVSVLLRSVAPAAKCFAYNGLAYFPLAYESPLSSTYFLADENGNIVMRALAGLAGPFPRAEAGLGAAILPEASLTSSGAFRWAALVRDFLTTLPGTTTTGTSTTATYTQTGITALTWSFYEATESYIRAALGQSLNIGGGFLTQYDGVQPVELGFHVFPEIRDADITTSDTGGHLGSADQDTSYWWVVTYEWTDATGAIHRSAPSIPINKTFTSGVTTGHAEIFIPTLRLTAKQGASPVTICVYRTIGTSPGVFYLAVTTVVPQVTDTINRSVINDPAQDRVKFVDELADALIIGNPRLYTTGGVLENTPPPACTKLVVFQNRLFGISDEDPLVLFYSQQVIPGAAVEFSDFLTINLDPRIGAATALAVMDEKLIAYGADSEWYVIGTGPDATGASGSYQDPQIIPGEAIGCTNAKSPILVQAGLVSQSAKGLYLLTRNLTTEYAGADVEGFVQGNVVTSAHAIPTTTQVRLTLDSGLAVVFDSFASQWGTCRPLDAVDATNWNGVFTYLEPGGVVQTETAGAYLLNGSPIAMALRTAPIRLGGLAGFQRVRLLEILGTYESPHDLEVSIMFDGNSAATQVVTVSPSTPVTWGSAPTWGGDEVWGGRFQPYIWRVYLNQQKCESVQVAIREVPSASSPGAGGALSALTFEIAVKKGAFKTPSSSTFGG
jgi:hypothetical protein